MIHRMGLYAEYFHAIREGKKTVEIRLNDERRRNIKIGDTIEFISVPQQDENLKVKVRELQCYETFEDMYSDIPFNEFDCEGWTMKELLDGTYEIYTPEQENEWGALAIMIEYEGEDKSGR